VREGEIGRRKEKPPYFSFAEIRGLRTTAHTLRGSALQLLKEIKPTTEPIPPVLNVGHASKLETAYYLVRSTTSPVV